MLRRQVPCHLESRSTLFPNRSALRAPQGYAPGQANDEKNKKNQNKKGDTSNEVTKGTFLTSFDRRMSRGLTMAPRSANFQPTRGTGMSTSEFSLQILSGGIELDRRAGEIRKEGVKIGLPEQLFRLLVLLMEHPGEVVTREEIRNSLWSDSFVNFEDSINSAIKRLRQSLDGFALNPRLIQTSPGHGYRFAVPTEPINPLPKAHPDASEAMEPRLAVVPFQNLSGNPAHEYLVTGLTDALITSLAKIPMLHVKSRYGALANKGVDHAISATGRKLKVEGWV